MADDLDQSDGIGGKHARARQLAEQAVAAQSAGDDDAADRLFAEADRVDPGAVEAVLSQAVVTRQPARPAGRDRDVAAMTRTVGVGDSPSRAGVSGRGSGADNEGT